MMMPTAAPDVGPLPSSKFSAHFVLSDRKGLPHRLLPRERIGTNKHYRHTISLSQLNKPQYDPCLLHSKRGKSAYSNEESRLKLNARLMHSAYLSWPESVPTS